MSDAIVGAICALSGVFLGKLFDVLTVGKTHTLALKKEYFLKKLNAFEKATTYYTITHTSLKFIANVFNTLNDDDSALPPATVDMMLKRATENLDRVQIATQDSALAIGLYTDLDYSKEDEILYTRYLEILGQIALKTQMLNLLNQSENEHDPTLFDKILDEMLALVAEIIDVSNKLKTLYTGITSQLRIEMRKYDN